MNVAVYQLAPLYPREETQVKDKFLKEEMQFGTVMRSEVWMDEAYENI